MRITYTDREEVVRAGDVVYMPPGHTRVVEEDFEWAEFSPPADHDAVLAVVLRNAALLRLRRPDRHGADKPTPRGWKPPG